jgi:hypothetical protein
MSDEEKTSTERVLDRRKGGDRRTTFVDPADLPFPDRRKGDRRQMDRRVLSEEEREALKKIIVPDDATPKESASE